jgi:hypothetical protein
MQIYSLALESQYQRAGFASQIEFKRWYGPLENTTVQSNRVQGVLIRCRRNLRLELSDQAHNQRA